MVFVTSEPSSYLTTVVMRTFKMFLVISGGWESEYA